MPPTNDVRINQWPTAGWSNWWGLRNGPRPGGMCVRYWIQTTAATGIATPLNSGLFVNYNNFGSVDALGFESVNPLPFSLEPVRLNFNVGFPDDSDWVINCILGIWLEDALPIEWSEFDVRPPEPARKPFPFPPLGNYPGSNLPGSVPNPLTIFPVNDNGAKGWS